MALPVDKIRIYYRWIHIYLWPAWVRQGLPHVVQSENPRPRTHEGETLRMRGQRVRQKLQHSLQVRVAGIDFLFYIFLFKNEAGKGMVDPENLLDLWTRGDWQFVLTRDILLRREGLVLKCIYIYKYIRYFSHKRTGQAYPTSIHFSKKLPGTCVLCWEFVFDLW